MKRRTTGKESAKRTVRAVSRRPTRAREEREAAQQQARTAKAKARFLAVFAETGNHSAACRASKVGRRTPYDWIRNDSRFAEFHADAKEAAIDALELEARRRAFAGTLKPVYQNGRRVGAIREYSDTLMVILLKAARPAVYRENIRIAGRLGLGPVQSKDLSNEDLKRLTVAAAAGGAMAAALTSPERTR